MVVGTFTYPCDCVVNKFCTKIIQNRVRQDRLFDLLDRTARRFVDATDRPAETAHHIVPDISADLTSFMGQVPCLGDIRTSFGIVEGSSERTQLLQFAPAFGDLSSVDQ